MGGERRHGRLIGTIKVSLVVVGLLSLGVRLVWCARRTELGMAELALRPYQAVILPLDSRRLRIYEWAPDEQSAYWLAETKRIVANHPDSADIAMGAAWVLDAPGSGRFSRFPSLTSDDEEQQADRFEAACREQCLALAERATTLEPANVLWWRMRAVLLFRNPNWVQRTPNWRPVLEECAKHDPDNALYDYLIAVQLFQSNATIAWQSEGQAVLPNLHINDEERFADGVASLQRAQEKKFVSFGEFGVFSVAVFLRHAKISPQEQSDVGSTRRVADRSYNLLSSVVRTWQEGMANAARLGDDYAREFALHRDRLHCLDQIAAANESTVHESYIMSIAAHLAGKLHRMIEDHPSLASEEESRRLGERYQTCIDDFWLLHEVKNKQFSTRNSRREAIRWPAILLHFSQFAGPVLLVIGLAIAVLARLLRRHAVYHQRPLGLWRSVLVWLCAFALTFTLFGAAPAQVISRQSQHRIVEWFVWGCVIGVAVFLLRKIPKHRRPRLRRQITLRGLFGIVFAIAVVCAIWPVLAPDTFLWLAGLLALELGLYRVALAATARGWRWLTWSIWAGMAFLCAAMYVQWPLLPPAPLPRIGIPIGIPQSGLTPFDWRYGNWPYEFFRADISLPKTPWSNAVFQWLAYGGVYLTVALALLTTCYWRMRRCARQNGQPFADYWTKNSRARWGSLLENTGRSAAIVGIVCIAVALWSAPDVLKVLEAEYQEKMQTFRAPQQHWDSIQRLIDAKKEELQEHLPSNEC